jgi:uncharacterized membrane protein
MSKRHPILERHFARPIYQRVITARPRLFICAALGIALAIAFAFLTHWRLPTQLLIAWNVSVGVYLISITTMMLGADEERMRLRAQMQDEGQNMVLVLTIFAVVACLTAIVAELSGLKDMSPGLRGLHVGLAALTIVSAWFFVHSMFALHYAHEYYGGATRGETACIQFPGNDPRPDYGDFLYFAYIIGTSGQTADVALASKSIRRLGIIHCILAFFFNTTLLALTINIAASLIS